MTTRVAQMHLVDFVEGKERFDALVSHYHNVEWHKMIICPCRKDKTTQAQSDCKNCKGTGYFWYFESDIMGVLTSMSVRKNFINWTEELKGTAYFSTVAENKIGFLDKLIVKDGVSKYSECKKYKIETIDSVPKRVFELNYEPLTFDKILEFVSVDDDYEELELGTDIFRHPTNPKKVYCADTSGRFESVSFLYTYNTAYAVIDTLSDWRNFHQSYTLVGDEQMGTKEDVAYHEFPLRFMLKKIHLVDL